MGALGGASTGAHGAGPGRPIGAAGGHGAARQPLRRPVVRRRRRGRAAGRGHPRLRRPVPLQDRLRPPPGAAAAEGRRRGSSPPKPITSWSRPWSAAAPTCGERGAAAGRRRLCAARPRGGRPGRRRRGRQGGDRPRDRRHPPLVRGPPARPGTGIVGGVPLPRDDRLRPPGAHRPAGSGAPAGADRARGGAPPPRRLRADRHPRRGARAAERDPLLRALPRARQGLLQQGRHRQAGRRRRQPAGHRRWPAARSTRRSRRCTCCASAATPSAPWRW